MNVMVFDIETVPDTNLFAKLNDLYDLSDLELAQAAFALQRGKTGRDFLPLYLHQIVAISVVMVGPSTLKVWSLGEPDSTEEDLLVRFFNGIEKYQPTLISYNGGGFDLPVIHYRALKHGVDGGKYWESGDNDPTFKWNNYLNRYHTRHYDLMDVLSGFQAKATAPLDALASMIGFPGKMGMKGDKVCEYYFSGKIEQIRDYCETDVLNTYGVYLRLQKCQGKISGEQYELEVKRVKDYIASLDKTYVDEFNEFLENLI